MAEKNSEKINLVNLQKFHELVNNAIAVNEKRVMANVANATPKEEVAGEEAAAIQITHKAIGTKKHTADTTDQVVDSQEIAQIKKKTLMLNKPAPAKSVDKIVAPKAAAPVTEVKEEVVRTTKKVVIQGQTFDNAVQAAKAFNIHPTTVRSRCSDEKYADWNYETE